VGWDSIDFLLKTYRIVVEVKKTRKGLNCKTLGTQLIEDIAKYKQSQDCSIIVCFIYDPEDMLVNPRGLITDLENLDNEVKVKVVVSP